MPLKVKSGKTGKTYEMAWSLPTDPSDDEIDKFIASQESANPTGPSKVGSVSDSYQSRKDAFLNKREGVIKTPLIKPFNTNDPSLATDSYPKRAGKELFNSFISDASSLGAIAGEVGGGAVFGMAKPYLSKMLPFLNKLGKSGELPVPNSGPGAVNPVDASNPALAQPGTIPQTGSMNTSAVKSVEPTYAGTIPIDERISGIPSSTVPPKPRFNTPDPVDNTIAKQAKGEARTLTQQGQKKYILPQDLRSSKPRFNMGNKVYIPQFDNDIDKAAYIIAQRSPSKRDSDFLKFFMDSTGMSEQAARAYGQQVRARIKANVVGQAEGDVRIPDMFSGYKNTTPLTKTEVTNAAIVKEGLAEKGIQRVKPVLTPTGPGSGILKNPNQETIQELLSRGYEPTGEVFDDGSIAIIKKVGDASKQLDEWGNPIGTDYRQPPPTAAEIARDKIRAQEIAANTDNLPLNEDEQLLNVARAELSKLKESYGPLSAEYQEAAQELADLAREITAKPVGRGRGTSTVKQLGPSAPINPSSPFPTGGGNSGGLPPIGTSPVNPLAPTPKPKKQNLVIQAGSNIKNAVAGLDLSFLGRQGRAVMHKKEYYKALPDTFKSLFSEKGYENAMGAIKSHPYYEMAKDRISFTGMGDDLTQREEDLMGNLVEKIPGLGRLYRATNRANTGFINKVRFDIFKSLMDDSVNGGNLFNKSAKGNLVDPSEVADLVNVMTGRGKLGAFEGAAPILNAGLFAPRFLSSRAKLLTAPLSYMKADPFVRKEALKSLGALVSSQALLVGLASASGMKHSFNLTNSDFGKFRVGKQGRTRIDTNAGLQQLVVLASRMAPEWAGGNRIQSSTNYNRTQKLDTGKFGGPTTPGTIGRFFQTKESPMISGAMELKTGRNFINDKVSPRETIVRHITPIIAQDIYDMVEANPRYAWLKSPEALIIIPSFFGASVNTYKKKK